MKGLRKIFNATTSPSPGNNTSNDDAAAGKASSTHRRTPSFTPTHILKTPPTNTNTSSASNASSGNSSTGNRLAPTAQDRILESARKSPHLRPATTSQANTFSLDNNNPTHEHAHIHTNHPANTGSNIVSTAILTAAANISVSSTTPAGTTTTMASTSSSRQRAKSTTTTTPPSKPNTPGLFNYEYHDKIDPTIELFYHPRTLSILMALIVGLVYIAFSEYPGWDAVFNVKLGIATMIIVFLIVAVLEFRDGPFIRPHPAFWRLILALSVVYQMVLVFILFQNKHDMRQWMKYIDPSLGQKLPERSYAENCELSVTNLRDQVDEFVLAHVLGWFAKAIILRDYWFCWILSIMFEIMEYSLQHQLPNFAECWWDHWILDVLVCNWLGTYLGMKSCEYFEMKHYSWRGIKEIPSYSGKLKRTMAQFTPHSWTKFQWGSTKSFKNYIAVLGLLYMVLQCELNAFYLKYLLWIPPSNPLNIYRLILFFFMCLPATREAYQFLNDPNCKRFGMHAWMVSFNILTELLICVKYGENEFLEPFPRHVVVFWWVFGVVVVGYGVWKFVWCEYFGNSNSNSNSGKGDGESKTDKVEDDEDVDDSEDVKVLRNRTRSLSRGAGLRKRTQTTDI